eukprot:m.239076 g.239076  ORF g.239076 m.239076 type:complete len:1096 (-) comp10916_c0_seq30:1836-5123(-)
MRAPSLRGMLVGMAVLVVLVLLINATAHTHVAPGAAQQPEALHDHHQPWNGPPQEASAASGPADSQVAVWLKQMAGRAAPAAPPVKELRFVWLRPFVHGEAVVTNALHRIALRRKLELGLPKDLENLMFPRAEQLAAQMLPPLRADKIAVLCTGRAQYDRQRMAAVVRDAAYFTMFEDPATQLLHVWRDWDFATRYPELGATFGEFVDRLPGGLPLLAEEDRRRVWNPQVHLLGVPEFPSSEQLSLTLHHVQEHFQLLLVSEFLDESLVLLAHALRVSIGEVAHIARLWRKSAERISDDAHRDDQIRLLNHHDWDFYRVFNATLWERIAQTPGFQDDLAELQRLSAGWVQTCQSATSTPDDERLGLLALNELTESQRQCQLMLLPASGFGQLFGRTDATCPPHDKAETMQNFVWIKTHKTGSSTITNLLHRYITKHNRTAVLPKDNIYLGWPADDLETAYDPLPGHSTYNALCSAHARYARKKMDALVPNAVYFTILRDPYTQFTSAWSYWDLGSLVHLPGMQLPLTLQRYINAWDHFYKGVTTAAKFLFWNSQAYDLGLAQNTPEEKMPAILNRLEQEFDLVMITEYMDESLVLMKRKLNWDIEDVVYFSFKVSGRSRSAGLPDVQQQAILEFNNNDWRVYQHMNKTLWAAIEREVGFFEEVAEMRKLKEKIFNQCQGMTRMSEDMHLRALVEHSDDMTPSDQECHEALLDSKTFSRYLKLKAGIPPGSWCARPPQKRIALLWAHGAGTTLPNILHRFAIKHHARIAIPRDGSNLGWPVTNTETFEAAVMLPERRPRNINFEMLFSGHIRFGDHLGKFVPHAKLIALLRDPVTAFLATWSELNMHDKLQPECRNVVEFVARWTECIKQASSEDQLRLQNTAAYDLGINLQDNRSVQGARGWISRLDKEFSLVLIDDRMDESLIMLKRIFCFEAEDIEHLLLASDEPVISPATREQLQSLSPDSLKSFNATVLRQNGLSDMYYRHFDSVLSRRAEREVAFNEELAELRQRRAELTTQCAPFASDTQEQLLERALKGPKSSSPSEFRCATLLLTKDSFLKYFTSIGSMLWKIRGVRAWCACLLVDACEGQHCVKFG